MSLGLWGQTKWGCHSGTRYPFFLSEPTDRHSPRRRRTQKRVTAKSIDSWRPASFYSVRTTDTFRADPSFIQTWLRLTSAIPTPTTFRPLLRRKQRPSHSNRPRQDRIGITLVPIQKPLPLSSLEPLAAQERRSWSGVSMGAGATDRPATSHILPIWRNSML